MEIKCDHCGENFKRRPSIVKPKNFCSYNCSNKALEKKVSVRCEVCGKEIIRRPSEVLKHIFCSRNCAKPYLSEKIKVFGESCKKEIRIIDHPLYKTWNGIKVRCTCKTNRDYKNYGGRGISICPEWADSFSRFCSDLGEKPTSKHTIDRIDNDGNYELSNVRWATKAEQNRNKRNVKRK